MRQRDLMVETQIIRRGISDPAVISAMRRVERHRLVRFGTVLSAYGDFPLPIGYGQTISQPYIVALMTEMLKLSYSDKVLEIGTGSGYQAAVLAEIADEVFTVEIIPELTERARTDLKQLGYINIKFKCGNGRLGWPEEAPFDRLIVTAASDIVPEQLCLQLKPGGLMVIPVGGADEVQMLELITRTPEGMCIERGIPVRFVPLVGQLPDDEK